MMYLKTIPSFESEKEDKGKEDKEEIIELKTAEEIEEYFKNVD